MNAQEAILKMMGKYERVCPVDWSDERYFSAHEYVVRCESGLEVETTQRIVDENKKELSSKKLEFFFGKNSKVEFKIWEKP